MDPPDYAVVSTVQGQFDEIQIRAFLQANGIPTAVRGESLRTTHGLTIDGLGAVHILVPIELEDMARELLKRVERGELRLQDDEIPCTG